MLRPHSEIRKLLLLIGGAFLLIAAISYAVWVSIQYYEKSFETAKDNLMTKAKNIQFHIESSITEQMQDLGVISQTSEIIEFARKRVKHEDNSGFCPLKSVHNLKKNTIVLIALVDTSGIPYHTHFSGNIHPDSIYLITQKHEVMSAVENHMPLISKCYKGVNQSRLINMIYPIFDKGNFVGDVIIAYNIDAFCSKYFSDLTQHTNPIEIMDVDGNTMFNSQPGFPDMSNLIKETGLHFSGISQTDLDENNWWHLQMQNHESATAVITFKDFNNETSQVILASVPLTIGNHKYVVSVYDNLENATGTTHLYTQNVFIVLSALLLIFILFWFFGWSYLKRFVKTKKETRLLSKISQSESRYWELFNASPLPIVVLSNSGLVSIANKEFLNYFGLSKVKNAYGRDIRTLIRLEDEHQMKHLADKVKRNRNKEEYTRMLVSFYHPNGRLKSAEFTASEFMFDERKNILIIINDLTEKILAENLSLRFGRILKNSNNEILIFDAKTHLFLHATDGALNNLGYPIEEMHKLTPENITKDDSAVFLKAINTLIDNSQEQVVLEIECRRKNGVLFPVEMTLQMSYEETPAVFIAMLRDLTQEKKAAETISLERSRSQEYLEIAEVMFVVIDTQGIITMINRKGLQVLEYNQDELIGKSWTETCVPEEARNIISQNLNNILDNNKEQSINFESQIITKYDTIKLVSWQHKPIFDSQGNITGILSSGLDTTDAKKQEFDLKVSQRQYATLISNLNGIVYRCQNDANWTMLFISQGVLKMTGYSPNELINNSHIAFSEIIHPDDKNKVRELIHLALDNNQSYQLEYRIIKKNGETIWVTEYGQGIKEEDRTEHVEGFITDITKIKEAEIQLIKLSTAIEQSASSIVITDEDGIIEYVNPYFCQLTDYEKEDVLGQKVSILKSGKMTKEHYQNLWNTLISGHTWHGEFLNKKRNGELYWESAVIAPVKDEKGENTSYIAIKQDITEYKQNQADLLKSQQELKINEAQFKALSEASFEGIFMSRHGKCIGQNKTAELMFGYSDSEVIDKPNNFWFSATYHELIEQRLTGGNAEPCEAVAIRKDLSTFPCEIKTRVAEYQGNMVLFTAITNIYRRIEAQKNLLESELRYRALIQNNTSVMLLFDPETGEIVESNNAASSFYGMSEEELKSIRIFDLNTLSIQELKPALTALRAGEKSYFVFKHKTSNGVKDVELYTGRMDYQGRELYFSVIHDITDKLQTQKELILAKEKAEESDRLKSAFLANMSHEIRTPMNAIIGFSQLLKDDDITIDESSSYISIITKSGEQLLELIDDIIKISQIEAGIINIHLEQNNLTTLLKETYGMFSLTVKQKGIDLHLDIPQPEVLHITTDGSRFKQILINLLSNAIKFTHTGEVRFGYTIEGDFLKFFVKDTGIGIDEQHYKLIFDRFMQVPHNEKKLYGGTGIGLSISQALVEKMGGKIWLNSAVGKGTEFYFTLPNTPTIAPKPMSNKEDNILELSNSLENKVVLIVEDDESNRQLLELFLQSSHPKILKVENGVDAVELINKQDVDIILMDIKMPQMNGLEATKQIKKMKPSIPIIIQTAYAMSNEREEAMKAGCDAYIAKPVKKNELLKIINELLST